jgi:two-component system sensor histidine kinase UhpB
MVLMPRRGICTPLIAVAAPTVGLLYLRVALAIIDVRPPASRRFVAIATACVLLPCKLFDTNLTRIVLRAGAAAVLVAAVIASAGVMAWGALRRNGTDARLMLAPSFMLACFVVRDAYVTATLPEHGFDLMVAKGTVACGSDRRSDASHGYQPRPVRPFGLDPCRQTGRARDRVRRLAPQEAGRSGHLIRGEECQRLTRDLQIGISGHLVSIIALSERSGDKSTEQAARDALNDLRLVIYSLDLGDSELPLALAIFRERLAPQLKRHRWNDRQWGFISSC